MAKLVNTLPVFALEPTCEADLSLPFLIGSIESSTRYEIQILHTDFKMVKFFRPGVHHIGSSSSVLPVLRNARGRETLRYCFPRIQ
jgi:hypothetical protein